MSAFANYISACYNRGCRRSPFYPIVFFCSFAEEPFRVWANLTELCSMTHAVS